MKLRELRLSGPEGAIHTLLAAKQLPLLPKDRQAKLSEIVGVGLYCALAIDNTMLPALNALALQQNKATEATAAQLSPLTHHLNCCATPNVAFFWCWSLFFGVHSQGFCGALRRDCLAKRVS